jgi:hypothetical protein
MLHGYVTIPGYRPAPIEKVRLIGEVENFSDVKLGYAGLEFGDVMYALNAAVQVDLEPQHPWFGLEQEVQHRLSFVLRIIARRRAPESACTLIQSLTPRNEFREADDHTGMNRRKSILSPAIQAEPGAVVEP